MKKNQLISNLAELHEQLQQKLKGKHILIRCKNSEGIFTIFQRDIQKRIKPASTVKIFLLQTLLQLNVNFDHWLEVKEHHLTRGSGNNLKLGNHYLVKDLLINLLVASSNTAASVLQEYVEELLAENYVNYLNKQHLNMGLMNIHLMDAHGLTNQKQYVSLADFGEILDTHIGDKKFLKWMRIKEHYFVSKQGYETTIKNTYTNFNRRSKVGIKTGTLVPGVFNVILFFKFKGIQGYIIDFYNEDQDSRYNDIESTLELLKKYKEALI